MIKEITRKSFTEAMKLAVIEKGEDYIYVDENNSCVYSEDGKTGICIIGKVLEILKQTLPGADSKYNNLTARSVLSEVYNVTDAKLIQAAVEAQKVQDSGGTWGQALKEYKKILGGAK